MSKAIYCKRKIYDIIRNNGNWENWSMIQIEEYPCENGNEARARERYWYEQLTAALNPQHPPNKSLKEKTRDNYVKNAEQRKAYAKQYTIQHKEEILEKNKKLYKLNRDKILAMHKEKRFVCECGAECGFYAKSRHFKSLRHKSFINGQKD